ncbi:hypothetical protein [Allokutzneria oryzae]|uniref:Uncharacterized protein n=1 Tax=Allokutzneria oryzae TaxID=1378989 RepID=A0ABV6A4F0_9PSEU
MGDHGRGRRAGDLAHATTTFGTASAAISATPMSTPPTPSDLSNAR